jgi:hypothetical protein
MYYKPTSTSTIINKTSCHPSKHKITTFNFPYNRINTYPIPNYNKNKELNIIQQTAIENNYYSINICKKASTNIIIKTHKDTTDNNKKRSHLHM